MFKRQFGIRCKALSAPDIRGGGFPCREALHVLPTASIRVLKSNESQEAEEDTAETMGTSGPQKAVA